MNVAPAIGLDRSRAFHWKRAGKQRPAGDFPTVKAVREIRAAAALRGIDLPLDWLIYGAPEIEVRALLDTPPARVAAE